MKRSTVLVKLCLLIKEALIFCPFKCIRNYNLCACVHVCCRKHTLQAHSRTLSWCRCTCPDMQKIQRCFGWWGQCSLLCWSSLSSSLSCSLKGKTHRSLTLSVFFFTCFICFYYYIISVITIHSLSLSFSLILSLLFSVSFSPYRFLLVCHSLALFPSFALSRLYGNK